MIDGVKKIKFLPIKCLRGTSVAQDVTNGDSLFLFLSERLVDRTPSFCNVVGTHEVASTDDNNQTSEKRSNSDLYESHFHSE